MMVGWAMLWASGCVGDGDDGQLSPILCWPARPARLAMEPSRWLVCASPRSLQIEDTNMDADFADAARIDGYHAHIYYGPATRGAAERLRESMGQGFTVRLGRWHDEPVGPHPVSMYQVAFAVGEFARLVPWLMLNRGELSVLVHPTTGDDYADHAQFALWLGPPLALKLEVLRRAVAPP
jgi:aromatic ring-cleaving dioxygenase